VTDHVAMNRAIRAAAGRGYPVPERPVEQPIGNIGVGKGGGAARPPVSDVAIAFNEWARSAWDANRLRTLGISDLTN
jgi:hypothetical protein